MKRGFFKNVAVLAGILAATAPAAGSATAAGTGKVITQTIEYKARPTVQVQEFASKYAHTQSGTAGRILNQRQYRKMLRQNPHFRNSKKCRI